MEIQLINVTGVVLGVVSPAALLYVFSNAIRRSSWNDEKKSSYWRNLVVGVLAWTSVVFLATLAGVFEYQSGDMLPKFLIGLVVPVSVAMIWFFTESFKDLFQSMPLHTLIGAQFFRLFGAIFLVVGMSGIGPMEFISSGYGDILTGLLALAASGLLYRKHRYGVATSWLFTVVGLLDLANVSRILLVNYPIWNDASPSTAMAGGFPMMLIVGITAPIALMLHLYAIKALLNVSKTIS